MHRDLIQEYDQRLKQGGDEAAVEADYAVKRAAASAKIASTVRMIQGQLVIPTLGCWCGVVAVSILILRHTPRRGAVVPTEAAPSET